MPGEWFVYIVEETKKFKMDMNEGAAGSTVKVCVSAGDRHYLHEDWGT